MAKSINTSVIKDATSEMHFTATTNFTFNLESFRITDTRSRHEDTDYVSFTTLVRKGTGTPVTRTREKAMGNVNNGTHNIGISFSPVPVSSDQTVVMNYLIVNSGHQSESQVFSVLEAAGGKLATAGFTAAGAAVGSAIPIPGLGTLIGAGAGWLVGELSGLLKANCDGAVALEQVIFTYDDLISKTAKGKYTHETPQAGGKSADGCGSNSMYYVTWSVARA